MSDTLSDSEQPRSRRNEIIIAIIGLVGVITTGLISNWDKIFAEGQVLQTTYSGYRPTNNFETNLRYYFEVSGTRATMETQQKELLNRLEMQLISENPEKAEPIKEFISAVREEAPTVEEILNKLLPIYRKHFTIKELQELNKFYSTKIMQGMVKKSSLIALESAPLQLELINAYQEKILNRIPKELMSASPEEELRQFLKLLEEFSQETP